MNRRSFPVASVFALLLIGLAWAYLLGSETARGQVEGITVLSDANGKPLSECDVYLTPATSSDEPPWQKSDSLSLDAAPSDPRERRHAVTDNAGRFSLRGVPTGTYTLSASARWHSTSDVKVTVEEGKTARANLKLTRSEPDLSISDHQATFTTTESPFLPVRGYVTPSPSATKPAASPLRVKVWWTRLSEVLKRSDSANALDTLRYSYNGVQTALAPALLRPARDEAETPILVSDETVPLNQVDREGFFVHRVKIGKAVGNPGLYLVKFSQGKYAACSYVHVTDLALVVKRAGKQVVGYTAHLQKGVPVANASLRVLRSGATLASGTTGTDGVATLTVPATGTANGDDASTLTMASFGDDEAVVRQNGSGEGDNPKDYAVHVVTDRTIYRPGDTVSYKGIVRQHQNVPDRAPSYLLPRGLPTSIEVRDESGGLVARASKTTNAHGSFQGDAELSSEAGTGTYTLVTTIAGEEHTSEIVVASYRKPEFSVAVAAVKARYLRGETVEMTLDAKYYFGAPVAGAKVHYYVYRDADWQAEYAALHDPDDEDSDYREFGGQTYGAYYGESVGEGDVTLDENGKATVTVRTDIRHPDRTADSTEPKDDDTKDADAPLPQVETYTLTAEVVDEAKRSVQVEGAATVAAGDLILNVSPEGWVARVGTPSQVFVTARDANGKPVPGTTIALAPSIDEYNKETKKTVARPFGVAQTATTGEDGRAVFSVTPTRAAEIRLTATAKDSGGRSLRAESSLWAASDQGADLDTDYGDLSLLTDKRRYAPGDTARVLVNSSRVGQSVLLSVEGDQVYKTYTLPIRKRTTVVQIPVSAAWGPNVTLVANYVRDKKFASSETPLRVNLQARKLAVRVRALTGARYLPGATVRYQVTTRDAATNAPVPAEVAFGVVDESIYALRADNPSALRGTFYPRRTNQVSTSFSFSVEYLGDVSKTAPEIAARRRFRDTAFWQPDIQTDADGQAMVTVTLPDNLTTWRATANAVSDETAVGQGLAKIVVSKPFFVRLETPRFLTGGDRSRLLALVHNETGKEQQARVQLQASGLTVSSDATQTVSVPAGGIGRIEWQVTTPNGSGSASLRVTAWTGSGPGANPFTDGIEQTLPIRAFGRTHIRPFAGVLNADGAPGAVTLPVDSGAMASETRLSLRVTPSVRGALTSGIEYLIGFPYGCTEQTLSRVYPDLLVRRLGLPAGENKDLPRMVRDGIARLSRFQHTDTGGWGWWERDKDDPFLTAYVLIGLAEAKAQGYDVDDDLLDRGRKAAREMAAKAPAAKRPFLLYALQQAGDTELASEDLPNPFRKWPARTGLIPTKLPTDALAYLCLIGKQLDEPYQPFYNELIRRSVREGQLVHWSAYPGRATEDCSDRMATALALRVLLQVEPNSARIPAALRYLMQSRTDGYFGNTRDTAWVLVALCDYLKANPSEAAAPSGTVQVQINGATVKTLDLATDAQGEPEMVLNLPADVMRPGNNEVRLVRQGGGGSVFFSGALRQTISAPDAADMPPTTTGGVTIKRDLVRVVPRKAGDNAWQIATEPVENGRFRQGDRLRVRLIITSERDVNYALIEDAFPSGAEVTERGTADAEIGDGGNYNFWYDHVDVRDDRIAFFARKLPRGKHVLEYNLRAQTPGTSRALPTLVEGMYDAGTRGQSGTQRLEVQP